MVEKNSLGLDDIKVAIFDFDGTINYLRNNGINVINVNDLK